MSYLLYGKRTLPIEDYSTHEIMGPDKTFAALDWRGVRVAKKSDAFEYATKADAEERLSKIKLRPGVVIEIRKAN